MKLSTALGLVQNYQKSIELELKYGTYKHDSVDIKFTNHFKALERLIYFSGISLEEFDSIDKDNLFTILEQRFIDTCLEYVGYKTKDIKEDLRLPTGDTK
jgi:hypothetical protein